jgi:hypothetical protein
MTSAWRRLPHCSGRTEQPSKRTDMSDRIVSWGHWVVALLACAMAVESVWAIIHSTVPMSRSDGVSPRILEANFLFLALAFASALCAWGIFKWRSWGYVLAFGISAFELIVGVEAAMVGDISVLFPLAPFLVVAWLLLPTVRVAYWRRASVESQGNS